MGHKDVTFKEKNVLSVNSNNHITQEAVKEEKWRGMQMRWFLSFFPSAILALDLSL